VRGVGSRGLVLLLGRSEVEDLLDVDALIDALAPAMVDLSAGRASVPARNGAWVDERDGVLAAMPGYTPSAGPALAAKLVTLFPRNAGTAVPTHQAVIVAFDPEDGRPTALLDGTEITAARTGAGSALATRLLTRVRTFRGLRVAGRDPARAGALARELEAELALPVRVAGSWAEACDGADVVCATTHAEEPVVRREWLAPGTHVTSVGFNVHGRELDDATVAESVVVVESRAAALAPPPAGTNDLLEPIAGGVIGADHVHAEIGEVIDGRRPGRTSPDELTLYKSVGVAVQDAAAAALVLRAAREHGAGREVDL
jgi:alanine dehydrogenase